MDVKLRRVSGTESGLSNCWLGSSSAAARCHVLAARGTVMDNEYVRVKQMNMHSPRLLEEVRAQTLNTHM